MQNITPPLIAIKCPRCGRVLAETDGPHLYVSEAAVCERVVTLKCRGRQIGARVVSCDGRYVWQPIRRTVAIEQFVIQPA